MPYTATDTLQITFLGETTSPSLKVHEARPDGAPYCGQPSNSWKDRPATYTRQGLGVVTCGRCARTLNGPQRR